MLSYLHLPLAGPLLLLPRGGTHDPTASNVSPVRSRVISFPRLLGFFYYDHSRLTPILAIA